MGTATKIVVKHSKTPDEVRPFAGHGHAEMHNFGKGTAMRGVFEPGWKWSNDVRPLAGTPSCMTAHRGYAISGRMRIRADDGTEVEIGPGDFFEIPPGHDAWVIGSEPCVMVDFGGLGDYAKSVVGKDTKGSQGRASVPSQA